MMTEQNRSETFQNCLGVTAEASASMGAEMCISLRVSANNPSRSSPFTISDSAERKLLKGSRRFDQVGWLVGFIMRLMQEFSRLREFSGNIDPVGPTDPPPRDSSSPKYFWLGDTEPSGDMGLGEPLLDCGLPGERLRSFEARRWVTFRSSCRTFISLARTCGMSFILVSRLREVMDSEPWFREPLTAKRSGSENRSSCSPTSCVSTTTESSLEDFCRS
mmetsp:Transcript_16792/g.37268  ORF Transcript_16792/g.37268 Transcript_16792/m.37268 type:complete len:219 (+) Transcript_16792:1716-2372(+)